MAVNKPKYKTKFNLKNLANKLFPNETVGGQGHLVVPHRSSKWLSDNIQRFQKRPALKPKNGAPRSFASNDSVCTVFCVFSFIDVEWSL